MKETTYRFQAKTRATIALLADFHNLDAKEVLYRIRKKKPDIICIVGDFVVANRSQIDVTEQLVIDSQANIKPLFAGCAEIAPTYVSLGNHEWMLCDEDIYEITSLGAIVLDNTWCKHGNFVIGGLTSVFVDNYRKYRTQSNGGRYPDFYQFTQPLGTRPYTAWLSEFEKEGGFKILLCHHPEYWKTFIKKWKIDLTLSGHAHGGQIRIFGRGLYATGQGWFPEYTSGLYDGRMIVSKGLSNTAKIPRLFNPTEIVYVELGET